MGPEAPREELARGRVLLFVWGRGRTGGHTSNIQIKIRQLLRNNHQSHQRKHARQRPQQKNPHQRNALENGQLQPDNRRQRQKKDSKVRHYINCGAHDEELQRVDARAPRDRPVPDIRHGLALEGAHQNHHDRPADGEYPEAVGGQPEVALASEDADVEEQDGDFY